MRTSKRIPVLEDSSRLQIIRAGRSNSGQTQLRTLPPQRLAFYIDTNLRDNEFQLTASGTRQITNILTSTARAT